MKFSVNLETVYRGVDPIVALQSMHKLGIRAFEFWSWENKDLSAIKETMAQLDMKLVAMTPHVSPNLIDPIERPRFLEHLHETIEVAESMNCNMVIITVGNALVHMEQEEQRQHIIDALQASIPMIEAAKLTLVIEPLNTRIDHPGYFLTHAADAFTIIEAVNSPYVKVLYDIYHQQITEGHLIPTLTKYIHHIGHIHAAAHPGRNELHLGEIHYDNVFKALQHHGYEGYIGLEYYPLAPAEEGLRQLLNQQQ